MKHALLFIALATGSAACLAETAAFDPVLATQIATRNACFGCHQVTRAVVGPSFQQIAARYQHDPDAQARMMLKIKQGGSGVWGMIPMPSHPNMSDADIKTVAQWVLAGAPGK
jgi:cytochrome c